MACHNVLGQVQIVIGVDVGEPPDCHQLHSWQTGAAELRSGRIYLAHITTVRARKHFLVQVYVRRGQFPRVHGGGRWRWCCGRLLRDGSSRWHRRSSMRGGACSCQQMSRQLRRQFEACACSIYHVHGNPMLADIQSPGLIEVRSCPHFEQRVP